ncbi:MAG: plastocyanin [Aphanocapsa sp. GSE-SYN-MK-11-07L]|nr:plastocyanin [Aphanocapsa sp. GSE-SYN-MK-11-07L]
MLSSLRRGLSVALASLMIAAGLCLIAPIALAETYTIKMGSDSGNLAFQPATLSVKHGDVVQWVNNKLPPHNMMIDGAKLPDVSAELISSLSHSQLMVKPGDSFQVTIPDALPAGEYAYFCAPHRGAGMAGKLVVTG